MKAVLVYQAGIANVFEVGSFNMASYGRGAKRLYQGDFRGAEMVCHGLEIAGATIAIAHCNMAGDIRGQHWSTDFATAPFADAMKYRLKWIR